MIKKYSRRIAALVACFVGSIAFGFMIALPALADGPTYNQDWLTRKAIVSDMYRCFNEGHMRDTITLDSYSGLSSLANHDNDKIAALPNTFDSKMRTCSELLDPIISGHTSVYVPSYGDNGVAPFLESIGYTPDSTNTGSAMKCYQFQYTGQLYKDEANIDTNSQSFTYRTPKFCANVDADGKMVEDGLYLDGTSSGIDTEGGAVDPFFYMSAQGSVNVMSNSAEGENALDLFCYKGEDFWNDCISTRIYRSMPSWSMTGDRFGYHITYNRLSDVVASSDSTIASTSFSKNANTPDAFVKGLLGQTTAVFTPAERVSLYQIYLNADAEDMTCSVPDDKKQALISNGFIDKPVHLVVDGKTLSNCYVKASEKTYHGFDGQNWYKDVSLSEILDYLAATTIGSGDASDVVSANANIYGSANNDPSGGANSGNGVIPTDADANEVNCFNSAGALGWILCPVIDFAQHTITAIYDSIVSNFLEFRAEFLDLNGSGKSVYTAWQVFQSFANIIFVIVLLVVIFSQLTGVGIDNLGIKRVLPKLIVAAILINLSYIICMLFVDISNITGSGINTLFANISVTATSSGLSGSAILSTIMTGAVAGAVGGLAVATAGIWGGVVVIPLVLGLITTLIGILFFFILLGARQAAIVILVVISPVAFACYMLPNTKSIFDKWLKIFEGLLILYPICGLLMGGSAFASDILMTLDTGFLGKLIAMLVGVVPFFFIPTLLRGAFSAMGNLGARISGFGQNMGRRLTGAIGNSDAVRDANTRLRTGINQDGSLNALGRYRERAMQQGNWASRSRIPGVRQLGRLAQESNRRANARAQAARIKYLDERAREDRLNSPGFFSQYQRSQEMALEKEQLATEMDIINDTTQKGEIWETSPENANDPKKQGIYSQYREAVESGNKYRARAIAEIAGRRKDTANQFMQQFKADSEAGLYDNHQDILEAVAKQMSSGDNSKNYRASNAMGFEYASQLVRGDTKENYGAWKSNTDNVKAAMEHHVTNGRELYGQSNASLRELAALAGTDDNKQYLADLARRGEFEGLNSGADYDKTKEESFKTLKGLAAPLSGDAVSGEEFNVRSAVPTRGNMTDGDLQRLREFYQRKVDSGTATPEDRETINRIDQEMNIRTNGPNDEQGTPV